jgi:biotin synthase-related radical SAM superfamily protein
MNDNADMPRRFSQATKLLVRGGWKEVSLELMSRRANSNRPGKLCIASLQEPLKMPRWRLPD